MKRIILGLIVFISLQSFAQVKITDEDLKGGETYQWTKDKVYQLDGYVFLEAGGVLNIEAGTVIKAAFSPSNGVDAASALIIAQGAKINAIGTEANPIIFTSEDDDINDPNDMDIILDRGSWGGLIILGNAPIGTNGGTFNIEGIPSTEGRATYGGNDPNDNSGTLKYVSIRYGGSKLQADNEINGLTLGGVGSGTSLSYIEVFANDDDGIEWFGGNVDIKYAVVAFCSDDGFDTDQSYAGRCQFMFGIQLPIDSENSGNMGGEHDGSEASDLNPKTVHRFFNATYIGAGKVSNNSQSNGIRVRNDGATTYGNSIFTEFTDLGLRIDDTAQDRYLANDWQLPNNIWYNFGAGNTPEEFVKADNKSDVITKLLAEGNEVVDPVLAGISYERNNGLDPRPNGGSPALSGATSAGDDWFTPTTYRGAFSSSKNWAQGWTALDQEGYFGDLISNATITIKDEDLVGDKSYVWTANNEYILDGYVFLEAGGVLNIEAGTVIKAAFSPSNGVDAASALIITQGAKLYALGTLDSPIIFTSEDDDINDPNDMDIILDRGSWGGLIMLGNAPIGTNGGTFNIEGIPSTEGRATYGGTDPNDDSGTVTYVSIRYGGSKLQADNEINGLTLGGVGSGTSLSNIEVFANEDDGIEWFGGNVDIKYAVVAFCSDDGFDTDQSYAGRGQFMFGIQLPIDSENSGNMGGEHDGSEASDLNPKTVHRFFNATYIGAGKVSNNSQSNGIRVRNDGATTYGNSIFTEFTDLGLRIDDTAQDRYLANDWQLPNNIWYNFGAGNTPEEFVKADNQSDVITKLLAEGNEVSDPKLGGISYEANGGLDPRPNDGSPALSGATNPNDAWFTPTTYRGAFGVNNWMKGWTALDQTGYLGDLSTISSVDYGSNKNGLVLEAPVPNPAKNYTVLNFELPTFSKVSVHIINMMGHVLEVQNKGVFDTGKQQIRLETNALTAGMYFIVLETKHGLVSQKLQVQ